MCLSFLFLTSSIVNIEMLSSPHPVLTLLHSPAARHSPLTCAALPTLDRPPIPGTADRVWVLMRRAWVGKWCVRTVASGVGGCCRRQAWLLKYKIYVILHHKARQGRKVTVTLSLRLLR